ncbi:hypothetical protein TrLO_g8427 [Triparma laevis f. longispina]|uniref:Uncharacterized protein n=1 Tax=Triparma laevis f. longispina TaxID=1714387 RepID=A0A9W7AC87_9STRA|nr:hypothetical protein TrLO_g8427 [Triparma laevis f. longispina]
MSDGGSLKKGHRRASSDPSHLLVSTHTALRGKTPPPHAMGGLAQGGFDFDSVDFNSIDALGNTDDIFEGSMLPNFELAQMGNLLKRHPSDGGIEDVIDHEAPSSLAHSAKKRKGHRRSQSDSNALLRGSSYAVSIPGPSLAVDDWNVPQAKAKPSSRRKKQVEGGAVGKAVGAGGAGKPLDKRNRRKPSAKAKQMQRMQDEERVEAERNLVGGGSGDGNSPRYDDMLSADILDVLGNTSPHPDGDSPSNLPSGSPQFFKSDSEEQRAIDSAPLPTPISSNSSFLAANFSTNVMSESAEKAKMFMFGQGKGSVGGSPISKTPPTRSRKKSGAYGKKSKSKKDQQAADERSRGAYKCGRCGMYKVNHVCTFELGLGEKQAEIQTEGGKIKCEGRVLTVRKWCEGGGGGRGGGVDLNAKIDPVSPVICLPIEQTETGGRVVGLGLAPTEILTTQKS